MARLLVFVSLVAPCSVVSSLVKRSINTGIVDGAVVGTDSMPQCSCACCSTQYRGDGTRWGRTSNDPGFACLPLQYSQQFFDRGFATCNIALGSQGQYCTKSAADGLLGRNQQIDTARYCFYECMPSSHDLDPDDGVGKQCVTATREALKNAGMHETHNEPGKNILANGADLAMNTEQTCGDHTTYLLSASLPGATILSLENYHCLQVGRDIIVEPDSPKREVAQIKFFGSIIVAAPLKFAHAAGSLLYMPSGPGPVPAPAPAPVFGGPGPAPGPMHPIMFDPKKNQFVNQVSSAPGPAPASFLQRA